MRENNPQRGEIWNVHGRLVVVSDVYVSVYEPSNRFVCFSDPEYSRYVHKYFSVNPFPYQNEIEDRSIFPFEGTREEAEAAFAEQEAKRCKICRHLNGHSPFMICSKDAA